MGKHNTYLHDCLNCFAVMAVVRLLNSTRSLNRVLENEFSIQFTFTTAVKLREDLKQSSILVSLFIFQGNSHGCTMISRRREVKREKDVRHFNSPCTRLATIFVSEFFTMTVGTHELLTRQPHLGKNCERYLVLVFRRMSFVCFG